MQEQGESPKRPQIILAGSSLAGMGFHIETLERTSHLTASKVSVSGTQASHMLRILENFPNETASAKWLFLELAPDRVGLNASRNNRNTSLSSNRVFSHSGKGRQGFSVYSLHDTILTNRVSLAFLHKSGKKSLAKDKTKLFARLSDEYYWNDTGYRQSKLKERLSLSSRAEQVKRARAKDGDVNMRQFTDTDKMAEIVPHKVDETEVQSVYDIAALCRERGIFFVICITPQWYGQLNFTQHDLQKPSDDRYIQLLQELNRRPDCSVIICRDFEEITNEGTDEDYLFDYGHMTETGAKVYTNWLVDQLLESPKTAEALHRNSRIR
jgi:hypothetical protein